MKTKCFVAVAALCSLAFASSGAVIFRANFDVTPVADLATYTAGPGDYLPVGCVVSTDAFTGWGGGWVTGKPLPPSIVTQTGGIQGGNALGCLLDTDNHEGYDVDLGAANQTTKSVTVEVLVKVNDAYNASRNEAGMETLIGNEAGGGSPTWALRTLGQYGSPEGEVQLMTNPSGSGPESNFSTGAAPDTTEMHHWAVRMDRTSNQMQLYLDEAYLGQAAADFAAQPFQVFSIGNFANPAGVSRNLIGTIDAVAVSDELLEPGQFVLLLPPTTGVNDWQLFE